MYDFIQNLNIQNRDKLRIYFHNLGRFDGVFIIDTLITACDLYGNDTYPDILSRNGDIFQIKYKNLKFIDSLKILPQSLDKLQKAFCRNSERKKGKINFSELHIDNLNDFKKQMGKYMKHDVLLLYEILVNAQKYFHTLFPFLDITKKISLPSISTYIYRTKYL